MCRKDLKWIPPLEQMRVRNLLLRRVRKLKLRRVKLRRVSTEWCPEHNGLVLYATYLMF